MSNGYWSCDCDKYNPDCRCYPKERPMTTPDLREAVARAIYDAWNMSGVPYDSPIVKGNIFREGKVHAQADAAIAATLDWLAERAQQIADNNRIADGLDPAGSTLDGVLIPASGGEAWTWYQIIDWLRAQKPEGVTHEQ